MGAGSAGRARPRKEDKPRPLKTILPQWHSSERCFRLSAGLLPVAPPRNVGRAVGPLSRQFQPGFLIEHISRLLGLGVRQSSSSARYRAISLLRHRPTVLAPINLIHAASPIAGLFSIAHPMNVSPSLSGEVHFGGRNPGDESHSSMCKAVSAWLARRNRRSRAVPRGIFSASSLRTRKSLLEGFYGP